MIFHLSQKIVNAHKSILKTMWGFAPLPSAALLAPPFTFFIIYTYFFIFINNHIFLYCIHLQLHLQKHTKK